MFNNRKMGSSDSLLNAIKDIMEKKHTTPETPKEKSLAKLAHPKDKITHKDVLVGRGVLKKENSGDRMGVIVGTRKEKVEIEPKLKEGKVDELKQSTVKSYTDKANKQLKKIGKKMMNDPDDHDGLDDKEKNTLRKRMAGFDMTFRKGIRASQKTTKEDMDDFAVASRSTTRGKVVKAKSGDYIATDQSGSTKSFNDKAKADKHASSGLKKEEVEGVDESKWDYPKSMTRPRVDSYLGKTGQDERAARKAWRKKIKATQHKELMTAKQRNEEGRGRGVLAKEEVENVDERKLTGAEAEKKEKYVLSMKKKMGGFKQRYGERAKEVMYATATKMAKDK